MSLKHVARIVEGKLYAWGMMRLEYPEAAISRIYRHDGGRVPTRDPSRKESPQEKWAVRHQYDLQDAAVIEHALRRMSKEQRRLIELRFVERWPWRKVAEQLYVSERTVYTMRGQIIVVFAHCFGLLSAATSFKSASQKDSSYVEENRLPRPGWPDRTNAGRWTMMQDQHKETD